MTATAPILWQPHRLKHKPGGGFQMRALSCGANEALFGGAAGPGKTDVLIACAARYSQHKSARGLFLRTTYEDLKEVQDRMESRYTDMGAVWRESDKRWYWPSGAFIQMGYGETLKEVNRYLGHEYTHVEFDELGLLPLKEAWMRIRTRVRSTDPTVPLRMRGSANPAGPGHEWLKARFVDACGTQGERVVYDPEDPEWSIAYVPGRADDNPSLPASYWNRLSGLPAGLVAAWRDGDWNAGLGLFYPELAETEKWFVRRDVLPTFLPDWWAMWSGYDWGYSHPAVWVPTVDDGARTYVLDAIYLHRESDHCQAAGVRGQLMLPTNPDARIPAKCASRCYAGHDAFAKRQAHTTSPETVADVFNGYGVAMERASIDREAGAKVVRRLLQQDRIRFVDTVGTRRLVRELAALVPDPKRPNVPLKRDADESGEGGDDGADALRYAVASWPYAVREPEPPKVTPLGGDPQDWRNFVTIESEDGRELHGGMLV